MFKTLYDEQERSWKRLGVLNKEIIILINSDFSVFISDRRNLSPVKILLDAISKEFTVDQSLQQPERVPGQGPHRHCSGRDF